MKRFFLTITLLVLLAGTGRTQVPTDPGIYAVFDTTEGSFTVSLFFEQVPLTVANFVGLAEGSLPWIDGETGQVRTDPFYDGLTFHRVIENFMIQSGSRNGEGTDGPGYRFPDEFVPGLVHATEGVLSMANSGFDTNGSQFFITVAPTDWLNYKHAVFGEVVEGMTIVDNISKVETASDQPVDPIVIHSIEIHRIGAAALAFDPQAHALPKIAAVRPELTIAEGDYTLRVPRQDKRDYILSYSNDLQSWLQGNISLTNETPEKGVYDLTALAGGEERQFYRVTSVDFSEIDYGFLPDNLVDKTIQLNLSTNNTFILHIDDERTEANEGEWLGTGTVDGGEERFLDYLFSHENNRGRFLFVLQGFVQINTDLKFIDEESGTFTGRALADPPFDVHGTFTLVPQ